MRAGEIAACASRTADAIAAPVEPIADDETGARVCGMRQWQSDHPGWHTVSLGNLPQRQTLQTRRRVRLLDQQPRRMSACEKR
jgi:hypothetical protein